MGALAVAALLGPAPPVEAAGTTLRIPFPRSPGTLTPLTFKLGYPLLTLVYDTVTWRDARGVPRPWLARSVRTSDDGRRVVVRLRAGLRWHDGRALTARDVAFTYAFMRARRHPRFVPELRAIASVQARDRRTVEFRLRHRSIGFADQPLADVPILPEHLWRGLGPGLRAPGGAPVGSGPFRVADLRPDGGVGLVAVRDYFRGRPRVDRIDVPIVSDPRETLAALRRGSVDMLPVPLAPAQQESVESFSVRIARGPLYSGTMLMFNVREPPFDRAPVRRAIAAALDRRRIAQAVGSQTPATTGFLHPRSRWAPRAGVLTPPGPGRPLAALGLPKVRVLAPTNDPMRLEAGRQVVLALTRAGAAARLVALPRARAGRAVGEGDAVPSFDVAISSIPALGSHDPDFLATLFRSRANGGVLNRSGYRSPTFDRLTDRVAAAPSATARRHAVAALLDRLSRDAPAVPLFFGDGAFAYRSAPQVGWTFVAGSGILDKQSFLRSPPNRGGSRAPSDLPLFSDNDHALSTSAILGAGALVLVVLLGGAAALRRRGRA